MASPGNIDPPDASVGVGDGTKIAAATADTASDSASAVPPTNPSDQPSASEERPKHVVSAETSFATSEAPSSNSANDDDDEDDDDGDDDNLHSDDGNNEGRDVGAGDDNQGETPSSTKKRKMVKRSREERLEMNRMTARERRRKAKVLVDTLQERVNELTRHNEALRQDNTLIRAQLQAVTAQNSQAASGNIPANSNANAVNAIGSIGSRGMAVSSSPSPSAAPVSASGIASLNNNDSSTAALLIRQLQQQQPQMSSPGLQQIFQASSTANPALAPAAVQAQIDQLRQQNALRILGLQVPPVPVQTAVSGISANGATNFAVPGSIALPTSAMGGPAAAAAATTPSLQQAPSPSDLATSALSAYRQQQQPPQGMAPMVPPAQINLQQLFPNNVAATTVLQNLDLLGGTGALPTSQAVGLVGATNATNNATANANANAAPSSPSVAQGTTNAGANIGNANVLAQLLPALLQQQQQQDQDQS